MGLIITKVALRDFRNYESFEIEPDPSLTILVGPNAVGKTNIVEAIELLTEADSFRKPSWADTVRIGQDRAELHLTAEGDGRKLTVDLDIPFKGARRYKVNGKPRRSVVRVAGIIPAVVFTPDDLRIVKDAAERRRGALDALGTQLSPSYQQLRIDYERVLRQRNAMLRDGDSSPAIFSSLTEQLIEKGSSLVAHRMRLFGRLESAMRQVYSGLVEHGSLEAHYLPSWCRDGVGCAEDEPRQAMLNHLEKKKTAEESRRTTLVGPHRDEIVFLVSGKEARAFASQGQQRTIALAWKLAEVAVITDVASQRPVLLLDDVMSELDASRRHALTSFVGEAAQTIVTTTNIGYFDESLLERAQVVELS
jgi:DNA replication and repair protein RecF